MKSAPRTSPLPRMLLESAAGAPLQAANLGAPAAAPSSGGATVAAAPPTPPDEGAGDAAAVLPPPLPPDGSLLPASESRRRAEKEARREARKETRLSKSLRDAAGKGDVVLIRELLAQKADVNAKNSKGFTPLMRATELDRWEQSRGVTADTVARMLAQAGADVNALDADGNSVLTWCRRWGDEFSAHGGKTDGDEFGGIASFLLFSACAQGALPLLCGPMQDEVERERPTTSGGSMNTISTAVKELAAEIVSSRLDTQAGLSCSLPLADASISLQIADSSTLYFPSLSPADDRAAQSAPCGPCRRHSGDRVSSCRQGRRQQQFHV